MVEIRAIWVPCWIASSENCRYICEGDEIRYQTLEWMQLQAGGLTHCWDPATKVSTYWVLDWPSPSAWAHDSILQWWKLTWGHKLARIWSQRGKLEFWSLAHVALWTTIHTVNLLLTDGNRSTVRATAMKQVAMCGLLLFIPSLQHLPHRLLDLGGGRL